MSGRAPVSSNDLRASETEPKFKSDSYVEQIMKYIPAEVVAFYIPAIAAAGALDARSGDVTDPGIQYVYLIWTLFFVGLAATFAYIYKSSKKTLDEEKILASTDRAFCKAGISTLAFFLWGLYLGGPFALYFSNPIGKIAQYQTYGVVGILLFTLAAPGLYDLITDYLTPPYPITIEPTEKDAQSVKKVTLKNRGLKKVTAKSLSLYSKQWRGWHRFLLEGALEINMPVEGNTTTPIDLAKTPLPYSKDIAEHFLVAVIEVEKDKQIAIQSDSFSANH